MRNAAGLMIRCPGCGGRNEPDAPACEWCHHSFVQVHQRGLSARWWATLSGGVIAALLLLVACLALLNATRASPRTAGPAAATPSPPPLLPLQVSPPSPTPVAATAVSPTLARTGTAAEPTSAPTMPAGQLSAPAPTSPQPTATVPPRLARIANTSGQAANVRSAPSSTAALVSSVSDGATVRIVGPEQRAADGRSWRQIEDSRGSQGWVLSDLLVDTPAGR